MTNFFDEIRTRIAQDPENKEFTEKGWKPVFSAYPDSKILLIGLTPSIESQEKDQVWDDRSGKTLCRWLDVSEDYFYKTHTFATLPMDFYYTGKDREGEVEPREDFAPRWHPEIIEHMPDIKLTILLGSKAVHYYLNLKTTTSLTMAVDNFKNYLPKYLPCIHPSGHNNIWIAEHPWFEKDLIPTMRELVHEIINE